MRAAAKHTLHNKHVILAARHANAPQELRRGPGKCAARPAHHLANYSTARNTILPLTSESQLLLQCNAGRAWTFLRRGQLLIKYSKDY